MRDNSTLSKREAQRQGRGLRVSASALDRAGLG